MKLNSLFTGSIGRPKGQHFLGSQPTRDEFCHKKTKHFVTIEIFLYDVGNPLGSMHKKSFRTGRSWKCWNLRWNTKLIFFVMIDFFSRNKIVSNQSFPNKLKPKLQNIVRKVPRFLNEMSYEVWDQRSLHIYVPIASKTVFHFRKFADKTAILKTATIESQSV